MISDPSDPASIAMAARAVSDALKRLITDAPLPDEATPYAVQVAADIADNLRNPQQVSSAPDSRVFLVHGHDHTFRDEVEQFLTNLGIDSVILSKVEGTSRSLLEKFESLAFEANFAVILLSPDDVGASVKQFEAPRGGGNALKYRARQNVVLELGFFYGRLGWENVIVIEKAPDHAWPEFERPSDLAGAVLLGARGDRDWRTELRSSLVTAQLLR